jgi:hypothetical protein
MRFSFSLQRAIRFAFGWEAANRACRFYFLNRFRDHSARWLIQLGYLLSRRGRSRSGFGILRVRLAIRRASLQNDIL